MNTGLWTAAPAQLMHDQTQLYLINDFTLVWTRAPICPHFLSYTVTNDSYWLNRVCQNSLCPDLCERISTILSGLRSLSSFSCTSASAFIPILYQLAQRKQNPAMKDGPSASHHPLHPGYSYTASYLSREDTQPLLKIANKHAKSNKTSHLMYWFQNSKNMQQKEFCRA